MWLLSNMQYPFALVQIIKIVSTFWVSSNFSQRFGAWRSGGLEVQMFKLALMLIEVQMFNLALMPPFCQTPVTCWRF
jgi:hypothetical protein